MTATFHVGDAIEVMSKLPEKSVDLILTSPPFLALRSYLPADHPDKKLEGGSQSTPGEYIDWLLDVVEACDRVLAPHGSLVFELGDTYAGSGGAGGDYADGHFRDGQEVYMGSGTRSRTGRYQNDDYDIAIPSRRPAVIPQKGTGWPLAKSLSLIPESFRFAMVYGVNPHTGRTTAPWRLRNVIRWVRPNPPVGALGDKFRPATSELMVFCKSAKRYFDLDAVREPAKPHGGNHIFNSKAGKQGYSGFGRDVTERIENPAGAPPLDWWQIPSEEIRTLSYVECGCAETCLLEEPDRFTAATSELLVFCKSSKRYFDLDAVRTPFSPTSGERATVNTAGAQARAEQGGRPRIGPQINTHAGAPPLDWWNIPPGGYEGAHYAVFPPELCIKPVKAMSPERVCRTCGEPSRRIVGEAEYVGTGGAQPDHQFMRGGRSVAGLTHHSNSNLTRVAPTLGFSDCGHDDWRPGLILDPFAGSGTTLAVATGHGRDAIGIDLDERNYELALERVGPFILERAS